MTEPSAHDLDALEYRVVRELLLERLPATLGRHLVAELRPFATAGAANAAVAEAGEIAGRLAAGDPAPLGGVTEVRSWLESFFAGEHQPGSRDAADLKRLLRAATRCREWLGRGAWPALSAMQSTFPSVADLVYELELAVDDRGEVLDSASQRLAELRRAIDAADGGVRAACQRFVADESVRRCLQSLEPSWRHGRPVFQVRYEHRQRVPGVLHDRSQSGATLFVEPAVVVEAANRLADARAAEHREVQVVLARLCKGLLRCRDDITGAVGALERLDLAVARARLIVEDGFRAVPVTEGGALCLRGALHPILLRTAADRTALVPLDVTIGDPYRLLVITGPNTGGKTVAMKTIGLIALMALSGVPVPAAEGTTVPVLDGVLADIGDEQAITQNLSTFSSHVTRIVRCLGRATGRSLVLLDELGAGTDPEEGSALGYAVLEHLERAGALAVVTTHLGRLKEFAYGSRAAENGAMAFDGATLSPLFRLDTGIPGTSHALDIAGRVGMPPAIVSRARELLGERDSRLESVIERVQVARRQAEEERRRRERLSRDAEAAGAELEEKLRRVDVQRAWLQEEAEAFVADELRAARELLLGPLKELGNGPRGFGERAKELHDAVAGLLRGASLHRRRMTFAAGLRRGSAVWVAGLGKRCVVHKVDRVREIVAVQVGNLRIDVPFEDVSWIAPLE